MSANFNFSQDVVELRKKTAKLLIDVVLGKISVLQALKSFPDNSSDLSVNTCFHILVHYEADEELRNKDKLYKETQDEFVVSVAETLLKGESLPVNIIDEYKVFYESDLIYKKNSKENIIKRLRRIINL